MRTGVMAGRIDGGTIDEVVEEAARAEADGFDTYWCSQIFGNDALTALAVVGREVPRIELGTAVVPTFPRHPMVMAQQALTADAIAGGRLCLGIGLSHQIVIESMLGLSFDKPVRHLREYLEVLVPLVRGEGVSVDGDVYRVHAALNVAGARPLPDAHSRPLPVLVAALGPQLLALAGALADGTITWCVGPHTLADHTIPTINAAAEAAGRPAPRVVAALPVCVTDDVDGARERAAKVFEIYGQLPSYRAMLDREGAAGPADLAIVGSQDEVVERIGGLAGIGVTDFVAAEFAVDPDEQAATREALVATLRLTG